MKKVFADLEFKEHYIAKSMKYLKENNPTLLMSEFHQDMLDAKQAVITFDNGITLSVIFGKCFYSNSIDTYEAMELSDTKSDLQPKAHLFNY